jgi:hypothetical protein
MTADDDFYGQFQCPGDFWKNLHTNLMSSDGGNIFLGVSRIFAFFLIFILNWYNRKLLREKASENVNVVPGLVLPYYFFYIYLYIGLSFLAGIIDFSLKGAPNEVIIYNWIVPIEQGLFHWLYEGLAFFLMRYGAGVKAIQRSLVVSGLWGVITFIFYFYIYSISDASYGQNANKNHAFDLFLTYQAILLSFYSLFVIIPSKYLYRRPALEFYAKFNCILYATALIVGSLVDADVTDAVCPGAVIIFIEVAFFQPFILFKTFQIDSQYWQGLTPDRGNPLADVWDHVDVKTAETMAERLEHFGSEKRLPILHFGLLDFDTNNQFVAGGFSRVYFGKFKGEKVAFKILFAMELTPDDVTDFYQEASLLASLKHENIVDCKGICVMPPALTMVLEHCIFGSLYDFLYKPIKKDKKDRRDSLASNASHRSLSRVGSKIYNFIADAAASITGGHNNAPRDSTRESSIINPMARSSVRESATNNNNNNNNNRKTNHIVDEEEDSKNEYDHSGGGGGSGGGGSFVPLDISKISPAVNTNPHSSLGLGRGSNLNNSNNSNSSGNNKEGVELDQLPRPSQSRLSALNLTNHNNQNDIDEEREQSTSLPRQSFLQKTMDTISGLFTGSSTNPNNSSFSTAGERESMGLPIAHSVSFHTRLQMMRDAVSGIAFMHSKGYMHCDIKSLNFLVDEVILLGLMRYFFHRFNFFSSFSISLFLSL